MQERLTTNSAGPNQIQPDEARQLKRQLREIGPDAFVRETVSSGKYSAKRLLSAFGLEPPAFLDGGGDEVYYRLLGIAIVRYMTERQKLPDYNTIDDAVKLLQESSKIVVITGAGISTNLGVPDFRSQDTGFYEKMRQKGFDSPEDIFDINTFREDPTIFYENSGPTLPELGKSTPTHAFIKLLDTMDKLLTNYTQNIDNVEGNVDISLDKLIQCHGSWATFTCLKCGVKTPGAQFYDQVRKGDVVHCKQCPQSTGKRKRTSGQTSRSVSRRFSEDDDSDDDGAYDLPSAGVMKPDITFFGEKLPDHFFERFHKNDRDAVDLVIVIGTSMTVAPVSEIPLALPNHIPHIYISRDRVKHINFDITLLGDCDLIMEELARRAGWNLQHRMLKHRKTDFDCVDTETATWRISPSSPGTSAASGPGSLAAPAKAGMSASKSPDPQPT